MLRKVKFLNNLVERDHRFIKKITKPALGYKSCRTASKTLCGIEVMHMIRKGQIKRAVIGIKHVLNSSTNCSNWLADQQLGIEIYELSYFCTRTIFSNCSFVIHLSLPWHLFYGFNREFLKGGIFTATRCGVRGYGPHNPAVASERLLSRCPQRCSDVGLFHLTCIDDSQYGVFA